jgi:pimeloyl-ACP methyl ester carboxylesterase
VAFYDQIGNGKSTHYRKKRLDTDFWTPDLIMSELENLLEHLGIGDDDDLLGQSGGGDAWRNVVEIGIRYYTVAYRCI